MVLQDVELFPALHADGLATVVNYTSIWDYTGRKAH